MSSGFELTFDAGAWKATREEQEAGLLERIRDHEADPAAALEAAAELLRWYARFGKMVSAEAQEVMEDGVEAVARTVACAALTFKPGARTEITPLDFFPFYRKPVGRGGPKKAGAKERALEMRAAHRDYLTFDDMRSMLTTNGGKTLPLEKWPKTIGQVEQTMADKLSNPYKDVPLEKRRSFVRESFPHILWTSPREQMNYPAEWTSPRNTDQAV